MFFIQDLYQLLLGGVFTVCEGLWSSGHDKHGLLGGHHPQAEVARPQTHVQGSGKMNVVLSDHDRAIVRAVFEGVTYVTVPETRVWKPDTFIRNEKSAEFGLVPSKAVYVRVFEDGTVLYSTRNT